MQNWQNLSVGQRLSWLIGVSITLLVAVGLISYFANSAMERRVDAIAANTVPGLEHAGSTGIAMQRFRTEVWRHVASTDAQSMDSLEREQANLSLTIQTELQRLQKASSDTHGHQLLSDLSSRWAQYQSNWQSNILPLSRNLQTKSQAVQLVSTSGAQRFNAVREKLDQLVAHHSSQAESTAEEARSSARRSQWLILSAIILSVAFGVGFGILIVRQVTAAVTSLVGTLSHSAHAVAHSAETLSHSSSELAAGASEQAASVEETSASSQQVSAMANQNANHAQHAMDALRNSQQRFRETSSRLDKLVQAVQQNLESSNKISRILQIIDGIAFQTNLLALNAAVEAARAGEAGMGFAIVADEVRNLAQRCTTAAKDTAALVEESITSSHQGHERVQEVATSIEQVSAETQLALERLQSVVSGSQEQSTGLAQIAKALSQIESVTQTVVVSSEQSSRSAEDLVSHASHLRSGVRTLEALVGITS